MMWKLRLAKSHVARVSTHSALEISAQSPDSGSQALENSHVSSAALAELVSSIGSVIDQLDYDGEPGDILQLQLERLSKEVGKYQNSRLRVECGKPWACGYDLARLIYAACMCSISIYDSPPIVSVPGLSIDLVGYHTASLDGTRKCTALWTVERTTSDLSTSKDLIVCIRGSAATLDHVVNLNGLEKDTGPLFRFPMETKAHAGFLGCAEAMLPRLLKDIVAWMAEDPGRPTNIVFTGHSAGGAVAALLFLHFVQHTPTQLSSTMFSLFTFGSAPVTSPNLTDPCKQRSNVGLVLSFINENDMVARADGAYLRSMVDLYRASHVLPPSASLTSSCIALSSAPVGVRPAWPLPYPTFHLLGDIILLGEPTMPEDDEKSDYGIRPSMRAIQVSHEELNTLIFCDVEVHRRRAYAERIRAIWLGACRRSQQQMSGYG